MGYNSNNTTIDNIAFDGFNRMLGSEASGRLAQARVAVIGVGGVGSWTVEALARCGIRHLMLVDPDTICVSNINRQLPALQTTVGREKVDVLAERIRQINDAAEVELHPVFLTKNNAVQILGTGLDYVVDAVDRMSVKAVILDTCRKQNIPVVTIGGSGGRLDPTQVEVRDLGRSGGDELLRLVRRKLRREHGWEGGDGNIYGIKAVFSRERMRILPASSYQPETESAPGCSMPALRMDCEGSLGSAVFVTAVFGMMAAGVVVRDLTAEVDCQTANHSAERAEIRTSEL